MSKEKDKKFDESEADKEAKKLLDSDADGLSDYEELYIYGTDPYNPDSDNDGLGDYQEVKIYGTNPNNPDTSGDGIPDGLAVKMGLNPRGPGTLADLFIPSPSNNYRPKSLHPKRLFFYAFSAVIIKLIMVAFLMSFPIQAWFSPNVLYEQAQRIVSLTNSIRIQANLSVLEENTVLNQAALDKAQDMLINQYFAHVGPDNSSLRHWLFRNNYAFRVAGENLAIGFEDPQKVVNAWVKSPTHYANIIDPDYTHIGVGVVSGEYKGFPTILIAQYFADPSEVVVIVQEPQKPVVAKTEDYNTKIDLANIIEPRPVIEEVVDEVLGQAEETFSKEDEIKEPTLPIEVEVEIPKDSLALPNPVLIQPANNSFLAENIVNFQILASGAEKIVIFANEERIKEIVVDSDIIEDFVDLPEGKYRLRIQSLAVDKQAYSMTYNLTIDTTPPTIDHQRTIVLVNQPNGREDLLVKVSAYLSPDAKEAIFHFNQYEIKLERDFIEENRWIGNIIIPNKKQEEVFSPIVMSSLTVADQAGNVLIQDLAWENIVPLENKLIDEYLFLSINQPEFIKPLFNVSSIYFRLLMILGIIALALNVFIYIKKQHYPTIVSSLAFILLMGLLTIF